MKSIKDLPENLRHVHPDAQYLVCTDCGRKSYNAKINESCKMKQPNESLCKGIFCNPK